MQSTMEAVELGTRILIVEDEMLVAADMEATLQDLGYQSAGIAPDMKAAIRLSEATPDLAFVDLNLRDGPTGPAIGAMLSRLGVGVVFLTANPRLLGRGVPGTFGVIGKPCDESGIGAAILYALGRLRGELTCPPPALAVFR